MAAFDRVLILNPNHTRTKLEIARIYFELKQFEMANTQLDIVLKDKIPKNVRDTIMVFKANIDSQVTKHFFSANLSFGTEYNDNANNDIGNIEFIIPAFNVPVNGNEKKSDTSFYASTSLNHFYDFGEKGGWGIVNTFLAYHKVNSKFEQNDATLLSFSSSPMYSSKQWILRFPLKYDKVFLDDKDYSHSFSASFDSTYLVSSTSSLSGHVNWTRTYNEQNDEQDSQATTFGLSYKQAFGQDSPLVLSLSSNYQISEEIKKDRTDVSGTSWSNTVEISKEIYKDLNLALSYTNTQKDYEDVDVLFGTKRKDNIDRYSLGLTYMWSKTLIFGFSSSYTDNDSNHPTYVYDKTLVNLNVTKVF